MLFLSTAMPIRSILFCPTQQVLLFKVISLFNNLEALYVLFSKSQRIHGLFETAQLEENLKVLSLKRLNTVRWNSREFCLKVLLSRYECILSVFGNRFIGHFI